MPARTGIARSQGAAGGMSLRLKTLVTLNVLGWLVAVPLLVAALLGPIVAFSYRPDRGLDGGEDTMRLAEPPALPAHPPRRGPASRPATRRPP